LILKICLELRFVKRKDVIRKINQAATSRGIQWHLHSEGANHTIYLLGGKRIPIARHAEIDDLLAERVFKECEEVLGSRWWR
jgi:hypothetical protein